MTTPPPGDPGPPDNVESAHRQYGRAFLISLAAAVRSLKLYPLENEQVQRALHDLAAGAAALHRVDPVLELQVAGEFVFINRTRLRMQSGTSSSIHEFITALQEAGVGMISVEEGVTDTEWQEICSILLGARNPDQNPDYIADLQIQLAQRGVTNIMLGPPTEAADELESDEPQDAEDRARELAKHTYQRSVAVTKDVVNGVRMGRGVNVRKMKKAVQGIVDQVLNNEVSLVGLTAIRDYDEYTFTHSVNVCIFSVAIGKRLKLDKRQLYDLGVAALLHDVGKSRVPLELINKQGGLSEDEWRLMQSHPWFGVLTLFDLRRGGETPYRGMVAAYEHHMKVDLTGYPRPVRERNLTLFSKIVAVADGYDAATSRRSYQNPMQPDEVLREMWHNRRRGYDPVLVKELVNLVGMYPVGTCLILDTREVGIVHGASSDTAHLHRPLVRLVLTPEGERLDRGPIVDLSERAPDGGFVRSIVKPTDPAGLGINPSNCFV